MLAGNKDIFHLSHSMDMNMLFRLYALTCLAMIAFAANSVFCRLALVDGSNDPISFTVVRLLAGAIILFYFFIRQAKSEPLIINFKSFGLPLLLFSYALFFSLAYVEIDAGTGALILFSTVQLTMMIISISRGHMLNRIEWCGFLMAMGGLIYLLFPGLSAPPLTAAILMTISGISRGFYSALGQKTNNPVLQTSRNFVLLVPVCFLLALIFPIQLTMEGYMWAILSGALTSGLGYVVWYAVLKELATSTAAIGQLSVPAIAALGGILFLDERLSTRLVIATLIILSGIIIKIRASHQNKI